MIKIYTTPTCSYCHALMEWLDQQNIQYQELSANNAPFPITAVPVVDIDGQIIVGFDRSAIKNALTKAA